MQALLLSLETSTNKFWAKDIPSALGVRKHLNPLS